MANLNDLKYHQCCIYMITNPIGQKYIGGTTNVRKRYLQYKNLESKTQVKIIDSIKLYGFESHRFDILEVVDKSELRKKELEYGLANDVLGVNGLNDVLPKQISKDKLDKHKMYIPTKETRLKISESNKGRVVSDITKSRLSDANLGKKQSEETKLKKNNTLKGQTRTDETKRRMSIARKGIPISESTKEKLRIANLGKPMPEYVRIALIKANTGRVCSEYTKDKIKKANGKIIIDLNTGVYYNSASELADLLGVKRTTLTSKLSGQNKNTTQYIYV